MQFYKKTGLFIILLLFTFSLKTQAQKCVASRCADGYQGCGCGPQSVECCKKRMQGNSGSSTGPSGVPSQIINNQKMINNAIWQNFQNSQKSWQQLQNIKREQNEEEYRRLQEKMRRDQLDSERRRQKFINDSKKASEATAETNVKPITVNSSDDVNTNSNSNTKADVSQKNSGEDTNNSEDSKSIKVDKNSEEAVTCKEKKKHFICHTLTCGGGSEGSVCCPNGRPYLSHCDCRCYPSTDHFQCNSYSNCLYEYSL